MLVFGCLILAFSFCYVLISRCKCAACRIQPETQLVTTGANYPLYGLSRVVEITRQITLYRWGRNKLGNNVASRKKRPIRIKGKDTFCKCDTVDVTARWAHRRRGSLSMANFECLPACYLLCAENRVMDKLRSEHRSNESFDSFVSWYRLIDVKTPHTHSIRWMFLIVILFVCCSTFRA